jgi:phenylalanyl-tRNA synthetase alpha chain
MIEELLKAVDEAQKGFANEIAHVASQQGLTLLRDKYFSRKSGILTLLSEKLKELDPSSRPVFGKELNVCKKELEAKLEEKRAQLNSAAASYSDYQLPAVMRERGYTHLLTLIRQRIEDIFLRMGYLIADGPEVELEEYNFDALNFLPHHPARDEQDTFFVKNAPGYILRTHTSPVQVRYMLEHRPPVKIIAPGKVFRKDNPDATHTPVFQQVEGLLIDRKITFSHLRGTLEFFVKSLFGPATAIRLRPGFFPFTEPSAEVDMSCFLCKGVNPGCRICKGTGWLEILGCGMVHRNVLAYCKIDPEEFRGFAFGMGIERIALLYYQIPDIRMLYENDLRFLELFG